MIGNFFCVNCTCGAEGKQRDFQVEIKTEKSIAKCPNNNKRMKLLGVKSNQGIRQGKFGMVGRSPREREVRSLTDFKKNTLETLPKGERKYFEKKLKSKNIK
jgi:hypothetical protein